MLFSDFLFHIFRPLWLSDPVCHSVANELYQNTQRRNFKRPFARAKWKVFLAPTGALDVGIWDLCLSVCTLLNKTLRMTLQEFLQSPGGF